VQGAQGSTGQTGGITSARAGLITTSGSTTLVNVAFGTAIGTTNYTVSVIVDGASTGFGSGSCYLNVESRTTTGFTFACRSAANGNLTTINGGVTFEYIAIIVN
jgi:hypothetical protein